jgi:heme exporter protein CcmB
LGLRAANVLVALLVLPLYIPSFNFGAGAIESTVNGLEPQAYLLLLGATLVLGSGVRSLGNQCGASDICGIELVVRRTQFAERGH